MPILSIITINRNNAAGLRKTIESVIRQTYTSIEYILIDGASNDESIEVIKSFTKIPSNQIIKANNSSNQQISYWITEPDNGIYNAMNKGIRAASGDYCLFLNSGDILASAKVIEESVSYLGTVPIVYGNLIKEFPKPKKIRDKNAAGKPLTMLNFYRGTLNHSSAFIQRQLFKKYGLYDENLKIVSDWKFYLKSIILGNEEVRYIDKDICIFQMDGISNKQKELENRERKNVLNELFPPNVLADYSEYFNDICRVRRIKKNSLFYFIFIHLDRIIFYWNRYSNRLLNRD